MKIDTSFDMYSDTPAGKDPDSHSPSLRRYHQFLWSQELPTGKLFGLSTSTSSAYLHHQSDLGEFFLSSDAITHTYRNTGMMSHIVGQLPPNELDDFFSITSTVGAYTIFPSIRREAKPTINGARGMHAKIRDRFDLTLECIRRHYAHEVSPLGGVLARYDDFFQLFGSFSGYVDFFLLNDLVQFESSAINFWLPFDGFVRSALPESVEEYRAYRDNTVRFVQRRNDRILKRSEARQ